MVKAYTKESFIEKCIVVHGTKYSYDDVEYVNNHRHVMILCKIHGHFRQRPDQHLGGTGCHKCSKKYSPTSQQFVQQLRQLYGSDSYDFSKVIYKTRQSKVSIICRLHGEFEKTPEMLLRGVVQCSSCVEEKKTKNFIQQSISKHGDVYDYSLTTYKNPKTKVKIICNVHGEFQQLPYNHSYNGYGCIQCLGNPRSNTIHFIKKAFSVHGERYDYSLVDYKNSSTKVYIVCKSHGQFLQAPSEHLTGKGCIKCAGVERFTTEQFIQSSRKVHGDRYDYSKADYINNRTKVTIVCNIHGDFDQIPDSHLNMNTGCPKCAINKAETWLDTLCNEDERIVSHGRQSIKCVDIFNNNMIRCLFPDKVGVTQSGEKFMIECDGPQHFQSVSWYGNNASDFRDQLCRDLAKNRYARDNAWSLLRISYLEYHNVEYWVNKFITDIEIRATKEEKVFMCSNPHLYNKLCAFENEGYTQPLWKMQ